jgi:hypothetical protein
MPDRRSDPPEDMETLYLDKIRGMSGEQRLEIAAGLSEAVKELAIAGIKHDHPGVCDEELRIELYKRMYG